MDYSKGGNDSISGGYGTRLSTHVAGQRYLAGAGRSIAIEELPNRIPGSGPMYRRPVVTDFWDETGTAEFEQIWKRTESGPYWAR